MLDFMRSVGWLAPERTVRNMLRYVLGRSTGASRITVARALGTSGRNLDAWSSGTARPIATNRDRIKRLFERFWRINNRRRPGPNGVLKITSEPEGGITIKGRSRPHILVENAAERRWDLVQEATTATQAQARFIRGVIEPTGLPPVAPDYLWFHKGHEFTIKTLEGGEQ